MRVAAVGILSLLLAGCATVEPGRPMAAADPEPGAVRPRELVRPDPMPRSATGWAPTPSLERVQEWTETTLLQLDEKFAAVRHTMHGVDRMLKWDSGVPIRVQLENGTQHRRDVERIMTTLTRVAGLRWQWAEGAFAQPNFVIRIATAGEQRQRHGAASPCTGESRIDERNYIIAAAVFIAHDDPIVRDVGIARCLEEELSQVLGPSFDSCLISETLYCSRSRRPHLTRWDLLALYVLYDPRLRPGMTRAEASPIIREIVAEHYPTVAAWGN